MVFLDYASTNPWPKYEYSDYCRPLLNVNANYAFKEKGLMLECEERIKTAIGAKSGKVIFGGTSSQLIENLMNTILSSQYCCDVFCSKYEHDSFFRYRDDSFYDEDELELLLSQVDNYTIPVVIWQAVQNITGKIFPTKQIGELVHKHNGFYICDGTAQIGHTPIEPNIDDWCDFYGFSGHKIGTELGIGCCWIGDRLDKLFNDFKLYGTPNFAGAMAITDATEDAVVNVKQNIGHWVDLYCYLKRELEENGIDYSNVIGDAKWSEWTPAINAIRLNGINARTLQSYLASKQVYVGLGQSSCAEENDNRILCNGFGLSEEEADEIIRISFGEDSNVDDVRTLIKYIKEFKERYV